MEFPSPDNLETWTRLLGVLISILATTAAAPAGTHRIARRGWQASTSAARTVRRLIAWLLRRHRHETMHTISASDTAGATSTIAVSMVTAWNSDAPVEQKLEILQKRIEQVQARVEDLGDSLAAERAERSAALSSLTTEIETSRVAMASRLDGMEDRAAEVDARGLPVLVGGVVIGGLAPEIGSLPLPVWWLITLAALGATMVVVVSALRSVRVRYPTTTPIRRIH